MTLMIQNMAMDVINTTTPLSNTTTLDDTILFEKMNRECILFPTYAKRDPQDPSQWIVKTKGWALSHNSSIAKQKMMMGITKSVAGKSSADSKSSQMFEERFRYFLATNKRFKPFLIQAIGITTLEDSRLELQKRQDESQLQQAMMNHQTLFLNMLSSRFNQMMTTIKTKSFQHDTICFPITPPTDDDDHDVENEQDFDDDADAEDWLTVNDYFANVVSRPTNPISSVLDGTYNNSDLAGIMITPNNHTTQYTQQKQESQVKLTTKSSGFLQGQFTVPHDKILNWAQDQNQCDARLIRIQSTCTADKPNSKKSFSPNYGIVSLIEPTGISIISDIDDTIKDTQILSGARTVLSKTFFELPQGVSGMADAYMAWYTQGASFHYVSNSPFQLMPMLERFLRDSQFPPGSMHLRDDGKLLSRLVETPGQAKRNAILRILADFPQRRFVLIGDSGEIDLEIYTRIASEFPDQILKIYIRDVTTPDAKTIHHLKKKKKLQEQQRRSSSSSSNSNTLSALFHSTRRSFSTPISSRNSSLTSEESVSDQQNQHQQKKKKFRSPLGMRRAVTTTLAEYAVEPRLTGHHRNTVRIDTKQHSHDGEDDDDEEGLLDPHLLQKKISTVEACVQLYQRVEKARLQVPAIDIILFQDAEVLQNDSSIRDALWDLWDDQSNHSSFSLDEQDDETSDDIEYESHQNHILSSSPTSF
ncbi:uncharacterized protein ATC70_000444 [Mucor velutinosus]|uniref:Phosphatidate phosphatase APP1 catalytic domain-containing protein n=1 Tax=Mucor velutinosus TaxID=708070 RepID=A0AAN7HNH3_9FUNG|nr:hypothetical protein ATC70_000444 [Mucor velutinosus]